MLLTSKVFSHVGRSQQNAQGRHWLRWNLIGDVRHQRFGVEQA
jgi:hypothetical protein